VEVQGLFKYHPPAGFKRNDSRAPSGRTAFFAREISGYAPSIMISIHEAGRHTAATIGQETIAAMKRESDMRVIGSRDGKVSGKSAFRIQLEISLPAGVVVSQQMVYVIHRKKLAIWTMSVPRGHTAKLSSKFEASLAQVKWLN
jgi:hypothetical protein